MQMHIEDVHARHPNCSKSDNVLEPDAASFLSGFDMRRIGREHMDRFDHHRGRIAGSERQPQIGSFRDVEDIVTIL